MTRVCGLALAAVAAGFLGACASPRSGPPARDPNAVPVTEIERRPGNKQPGPVTVPPPAYGHRIAMGAVGSGPSRALASQSAAGDQPNEAACIEYWPEIRYRNYGYDHIVHLWSRCAARAFCRVSSDVTPNTVEVEVPPRGEAQVLVFRGSPARQFTPRVECRFQV